jgi:hypothetical protein
MVDRLNTKTMLKRRNISSGDEDEPYCVTCNDGADEDIEHLFFTCSFARNCWEKINIEWNLSLSLHPRIAHARQQQNTPFFMEIVIVASWEIWKARNDKIFRNRPVHVGTWFSNFKNQCRLQSLRFRDDLRSAFCFWLDAYS